MNRLEQQRQTMLALLEAIPEEVRPRLMRAINEMLAARCNTHVVRDALSKQQSFGKYAGCTPTAILAIANEVCQQLNRDSRAAFNQALANARRSI